MIFKVYICQGPQHHVCEVASAFDGGCELCGYDIDEVEVVRVDELTGDDAIKRVARHIYQDDTHPLAIERATAILCAALNRQEDS
jgi:hypothetical protein